MFQLQSPTMNHTFSSSLALDLIFLSNFLAWKEACCNICFYIYFGAWWIVQSVPELYPSFSMPLKPDLRKNVKHGVFILFETKKTNSKLGFNSSCKRRGTRVFCFHENCHFCFHFLLDLISAQDGQFRDFKPKQTPLFSRPQIPGLERCFQLSTTPAGLIVKETWKFGLNTKRELAFQFLPKPSDLTPPPFFFSFFLSFLSSHPWEFQAWHIKPWTFKLLTHQQHIAKHCTIFFLIFYSPLMKD